MTRRAGVLTTLALLLGIPLLSLALAGPAAAADPAPPPAPAAGATGSAPAAPLLTPPGQFHGGALYQRHVAAGLTCASCHKENPPSTPVPTATCLSCHGSYDALADQTENIGPANPHDSHQGQLPCESCHHIHMPSVSYCAQCHQQFHFQVP